VRWHAILKAADSLGLDVKSELTLQLGGEPESDQFPPRKGYQQGYDLGQKLVSSGGPFTALFAFNDGSAIGAMKAFQEGGSSCAAWRVTTRSPAP
jgi:LacI family transcriptional regulator